MSGRVDGKVEATGGLSPMLGRSPMPGRVEGRLEMGGRSPILGREPMEGN
jgi:hypothetical protein